MEKLKIGDKVQILPTLEEDDISYKGISVVETMLRYAGKTATITHVIPIEGLDKWCYKLNIDDGDWSWTSRMFIPNSITAGKRERNRSITF